METETFTLAGYQYGLGVVTNGDVFVFATFQSLVEALANYEAFTSRNPRVRYVIKRRPYGVWEDGA